MSREMRLFSVVALVVGLLLAQRMFKRDDAELFFNRLWVERMPKDERDMVTRFLTVRDNDLDVGAFVVASQWRTFIEIFLFSVDGNTLKLEFPQPRTKISGTFRAWKCEGSAPKPFELCAELKAGKSKLMLYSMEDWVIEPGSRTMENGPIDLPRLPSSPVEPCADCVEGWPASLQGIVNP